MGERGVDITILAMDEVIHTSHEVRQVDGNWDEQGLVLEED